MTINFYFKIKKYKIMGSAIITVIVCYLVCLIFAIYANLNPSIPPETSINPWIAVASSLFDALKMIALSIDKASISAYINAGSYSALFGVGYVLASVFALIFTSISVILATVKTFKAKLQTILFSLFTKRDIYYIFSDSRSEVAVKFAEKLKRSKNSIVVLYITRASQKTQEGTEYKDMLLSKGFDVKTENFTEGLFKALFRRFGGKHRVFCYGLFSNDELSLRFAENFTTAILENKKFNILKEKEELTDEELLCFEHYKVLINYIRSDIDLNNNYSSRTCHIINTLSQYDIISTDFIMNNTIDRFVDINKISKTNNDGFNVSFLGFGKVNKQIYEKMIQAYQLWDDSINKVHYHILDRGSDVLALNSRNLYTDRNNNEVPFLYSVDAFCNGEDLLEYNTVNNHIKTIGKQAGRFSNDGFEIFIVSASNINDNIKIALSLRRSLFTNIVKDKLLNTYIFVRINEHSTAGFFKENNVEKDDNDKSHEFVITQQEFNKMDLIHPNHLIVPIVIFGEDDLISTFVPNHYHILDKLGMAAMKSYYRINDFCKARTSWLKMNKKETLANIETNYSLRVKLKVLDYTINNEYQISSMDGGNKDLSSKLKELIEKCDFSEINSKNPVFKLAGLEHNRWLANSYLHYKYEPLSFEQFISQNTVDGSFIVKNSNWTKENGVKHVCMVTNSKLSELRTLIYKNNVELKEKADYLTFYTDVHAIYDVISALKSLQNN